MQLAKDTSGLPYKFVYLPVAIMQTSTGGGGPLKNGDFEQGSTLWSQQTTQPVLLIVDANELKASLPQANPHSGNWVGWLGGFNNENATLSQSVTVPVGAPYLIYWQLIASTEAANECGADVGRVLISSVTVPGSLTDLCVTTNTYPNWQRKSFNLSAYAGQNVTLAFNFRSDFAVESSWLLDDIAFSATP